MTADFLPDDQIDHFSQSVEDFENPQKGANSDENYHEPHYDEYPKSKFASNLGTLLYWLLEILLEILTAL